ncbi:ATP-binding cassette domain-containing protein [Erysipelothrix tonsillarum]|uniref:ATP-binding cassette domain-containing protein n=1 Tax=Erysipelothrix tonsillarum TaxID=38402 RepID=UPI00039FC64E|nr:ATP-binding cassette domain-containing protein [Erysipelothrix tonsillarum]
MINITHVSKSFKQQCILNSVNLSIQTGETIYIKGANGSGKSTLLKIIAGLLAPDTGMIEGTADLNIGALIENPSFIEDRPLLDNLKFLYTLKNKFNHDAIKKYCDYFELDLNSKKR